MHHIINTEDEPYLDWIISGQKTYEGRLASKIIDWRLKVGKQLTFFSDDDSYAIIEITSLPVYLDFGAAFDDLGAALIPERTREQVINMYNKIFTEAAIEKHGVVAIGFKLVETCKNYV